MKLATTHINADLDGVASLVALRRLEGPIEIGLPASMDPSAHRFWTEHERNLPELVAPRVLAKRLEEEPLERLLVVDTADPARLGVIAGYVGRFDEVLSWDTHPELDGDLARAAMPAVCACVSGLVLRLEQEGKAPPPTEAGLFLLGIHVDTGHFTYAGTTPLDHRAAAICLEWGAPEDWPGRYAPKGFTSHQLALLERMSHQTELIDGGDRRIALVWLELDGYEPDLSVLLEQLREAEEWPAAFLLATLGDRTFLIGRSRSEIDVASIMRALGGGGHPDAASAVLRELNMRDARALVRQTITETLGRGRRAGDVAVSPFHSLGAQRTIREAADALHRFRINALPLTRGRGKQQRVVGLVSRQEIDAAVRHGLGDHPVGEISHIEPIWVPTDSSLIEARRALLEGPGRLIMVGDPPHDVVGVLTRSVLFRDWADDPPRAESRKPPHSRTVQGLAGKALGAAWDHVLHVGELGRELGMPAHLVGGTVRDILLRTPIRDIDVVIEGSAPEVAKRAVERFGGNVRIHQAFATATWLHPDGTSIDLASTRSEFYETPAALPRVTRAGLRQDLYRRDFTINAMALSVDPNEVGRIRDPFGGLADLHNGMLRVLHGLSFYDDPTRAWRAARLAARLDFRVAPEVQGLMRSARRFGVFERVGLPRLGSELDLILREREVEQAFRLLRQWKLLAYIHESLRPDAAFFDQIGRVKAAWNRMRGLRDDVPPREEALWIVLASQIPEDERSALQDLVPGGLVRHRLFLHGPERVRHTLHRLRRADRPSRAARVVETLNPAERVVALALSRSRGPADWLVWWEREGHQLDSCVNGDRLIELGYAPGPTMGDALDAALDAARDGGDEVDQLAAAEHVFALARRAGQ